MKRESRFRPLLNAMLLELIYCWQSKNTERLKTETAIMITAKHCEQVKKELILHPFTSDEEEITFFKKVQPQFTGQLCYYTILYEAFVSVPENDDSLFWQNELHRYFSFVENYADFICYMDDGKTDQDELYFLRRKNRYAQTLYSKVYGIGEDMTTSHDHLASAWYTEKLYYRYVSAKMDSGTGSFS